MGYYNTYLEQEDTGFGEMGGILSPPPKKTVDHENYLISECCFSDKYFSSFIYNSYADAFFARLKSAIFRQAFLSFEKRKILVGGSSAAAVAACSVVAVAKACLGRRRQWRKRCGASSAAVVAAAAAAAWLQRQRGGSSNGGGATVRPHWRRQLGCGSLSAAR